MKKCNECNVEMIKNGKILSKLRYEIGADAKSDIFVEIPTGEKASFLGMKVDKTDIYEVRVRICPNCGKVETYIDINKKEIV